MRREENKIILKKNDCLYRYILGTNVPETWSNDVHNPEYNYEDWGHKNSIGAFFFYDKEIVAKQVLAQAVYDQRKLGNTYNKATITSCHVNEDIVLLDLEKGLVNCTQIISVLRELDLDVVNDSFYKYCAEGKVCFAQIKDEVDRLYSHDKTTKLMAAKEVNEFFYNLAPFLCQQLTDFDNGKEFKKILLQNGYEGYVFMEQLQSNTYCILESNKISAPEHKVIEIDNDMEIQELINRISICSKSN